MSGEKTNQEILEDIDLWCGDYSPYEWTSWFEKDIFIYQFFFPDDSQNIDELIEVLDLCDYIEERFLLGYSCQSTIFIQEEGEICLEVEFIKD